MWKDRIGITQSLEKEPSLVHGQVLWPHGEPRVEQAHRLMVSGLGM